jgi:hypothetical protein
MDFKDNETIQNFIKKHEIPVRWVRTKGFLGYDIWYEKKDGYWNIDVYPGLFRQETYILFALASILRREQPWFPLLNKSDFNRLVDEYIKAHLNIGDSFYEYIYTAVSGFYDGFCFLFEAQYLLSEKYISEDDFVQYKKEIRIRCATESSFFYYLCCLAVLRTNYVAVDKDYGEIIKDGHSRYIELIDIAESCIKNKIFKFEDIYAVFKKFHENLHSHIEKTKIKKNLNNDEAEIMNSEFMYDVALSFAGQDRKVAKELASLLKDKNVKVFYDEFEKSKIWGKDLYQYLSEIYQDKAQYCCIFLSKHYVDSSWAKLELKASQARAFEEVSEYMLPVRLDFTEVPGILNTTAYIDLNNSSLNEVAELLEQKINESKL